MPVGTYLSVDMKSFVLHLYINEVVIQGLFGVLLFVYVPNLDPYPGYTPRRDDVIENTKYEELPGTEQICPERHVNILSKIFFTWMNPLMELGYKRPLTEKEWKLDTWEQTETIILQICQSLHTVWSAPIRIVIAMILLYRELGVASIVGAVLLVFLFPLQTYTISKMQKLSKEGLQRTDKRIGKR